MRAQIALLLFVLTGKRWQLSSQFLMKSLVFTLCNDAVFINYKVHYSIIMNLHMHWTEVKRRCINANRFIFIVVVVVCINAATVGELFIHFIRFEFSPIIVAVGTIVHIFLHNKVIHALAGMHVLWHPEREAFSVVIVFWILTKKAALASIRQWAAGAEQGEQAEECNVFVHGILTFPC